MALLGPSHVIPCCDVNPEDLSTKGLEWIAKWGTNTRSSPEEVSVPVCWGRQSQREEPWPGSLPQDAWVLRFIWNWQPCVPKGLWPLHRLCVFLEPVVRGN